ncbi:tripartite tricarboxylate transporter substrate binding protein [Paraburkholderia sp. MPAMCS5]|uniref:Bug family tripartite tricarboxylate transporter substrate binding protein n=1 Tax=Paraburkholderia sp. MPAMCS5 TaxID=3112563 RepID=UPI002E17CF98|nr:tripartite tricarboxylate transporter substrate binding protein [Paraburkholderia sp. MPAMCS5]
MQFLRRAFAAFAALALSTLCATSVAHADTFPDKPIHIIVPYVPGGSTDLLARVVAKQLAAQWGQPVIVENHPGANGIIGADLVAKAPADGYVIGIASPGTHAANASLYKHLPYDTVKSFTPITLAVNAPLVLVAHPSLQVKTVQELIAKAKASPGTISYASGGIGSSQHLAMELFDHMAGISMTHVPYKGSANSYTDLLGGRVKIEFDAFTAAMPYIKSGQLIALGVAASKRVPAFPNLPTVAESGVPGFEASSWYGFVAPANLPKDVLAKLNAGIVKALQTPAAHETLTGVGLVVVGDTPDQFAQFIKDQIALAGKVVKWAAIKPQ